MSRLVLRIALCSIAASLGPSPFVDVTSASPLKPQGPPIVPSGLLRDPLEWDLLPTVTGDAKWDNVVTYAGLALNPPTVNPLVDQDSDRDIVALACALYWRGDNTAGAAAKVRARDLIAEIVTMPLGTPGSGLAPGRNLLSYILAADLIQLPSYDPPLNASFRTRILLVTEGTDWVGVSGFGSFENFAEHRPNNIGLLIGASRLAAAMYLVNSIVPPDTSHIADIIDQWDTFRAFCGDTSIPNSFSWGGPYNDLTWHLNEGSPKGINPTGTKQRIKAVQPGGNFCDGAPGGAGKQIGGALPDDMRRTSDDDCDPTECTFHRHYNTVPGPNRVIAQYPWEALQGLVMQAYLFDRCTYPAFWIELNAIERTHHFLYVVYHFPAEMAHAPDVCDINATESDDTYVPHIVNALYPEPLAPYLNPSTLIFGGKPGKNCGFADWWTIGYDGYP